MDSEKRSFGLSTKIIATTLTLVVGVVAVNYAAFMHGYARDAEAALMNKASAFTAVADETKNHTSKLHAKHAFDSDKLLADALEHVAKGGNYADTEFYETIPVVAGWSAAGEAAKTEGLDFRVPAFDARNPENLPEAGSFREQLLRDLTAQVGNGGEPAIGRIDRATNTLHYMRAIKLDESCMMCHGDPAKYDVRDENGAFDGKDFLGFKMESWKVGDMHGAFEVAMPLAAMDKQISSFFINGMMYTIPLVIGAAIGLIIMLRRLLTKPLNDLVMIVKDIATGDGDLTKRINIKRGDEIGLLGHWVDTFLSNLHTLIGDVAGSTREVASAATQIAASAEQMSAGLSRQEQQTSQVSAAVEELSASVAEVAKKSADANHASADARKQADEGGNVVRETVTEINAIADDVTKSAGAVTSLGKKSEQIGEIINVINDIADQTNLLALNAAIEAARAGEHGRGFAVVADEVRKLAERTTTATEEVAKSIREIQNETHQAVQIIEASSTRVNKGVSLAGEAGESLGRIVAGNQTVTQMVETIAAAAEEQSAASEQIARSIEQINAVTKESTQGAGQAASAATMLSRQSEKLQSLVGRFKL